MNIIDIRSIETFDEVGYSSGMMCWHEIESVDCGDYMKVSDVAAFIEKMMNCKVRTRENNLEFNRE